MNDVKYKIILVDDDPVMLDLHSAYLESSDYDILFANNGIEALKIINEHAEHIGVVVSDVSMPEMDGYELCQCLKEDTRTSHFPVIFVSALSSLAEKLKGYSVGGDDYIIKPVEEIELLEKTKTLIARQIQIAELNKTVKETRNVALQAMTFSSELGQVIEFYKIMLSTHSHEELAQCLFDIAECFELICTLQIHTPTKILNLCDNGIVSPLEENVIEMARKTDRFFDFGARTIINYDDFSLLIKNMPVFEHEKYGRIKDIFGMLANGLEAKIKQLNSNILAEKKQEVIESIQDSLGSIEKSFGDVQKENMIAIEDMNDDISEAIMVLNLLEYQEDNIKRIVMRCLKRVNKSFYTAISIRENLTNINDKFHSVLGL